MGLTFGEMIGSLGGAIIGGFIGGFPGMMMGMSLGGMVGGWIDPPPAPDPPDLGDLGLNTYVHNEPISLAYGQNKLYGGVIWIGDVATDTNEGGSKKSPQYSTVMQIEWAVSHCEGPCGSVLKYWINDKTVPELIEEDAGLAFSFTSYNGTDSQSVDPNISEFLSGNESPAVPFIYTAYTYVYASWDGGVFNVIPNFSCEMKCLLTEEGEEDANPIRVLYDFLTNVRYGVGIPTELFDGDPDTADCSWKIASDYCDESIAYVDGDDNTIYEPRFRYSNVFDSRVKGYDIISDILKSCRGILSWCQGQLYVIIENGNEEIINYYSDEKISEFTSTGASTVDRIYVNESITDPSGFWEACEIKFSLGGDSYIIGMVDTFGADYFDLVESLSSPPILGTTIYVKKDNIKEGSFNYRKTSQKDRYSSIRVEFINRKIESESTVNNEYQWDVVEHDQPEVYSDAYVKIVDAVNQQQIRISGIKRKSQAMRLAKWYADCCIYLNYYCEFSTDMVGYIHKVGDIIGISHTTMGWENKPFRVIGMEEISNDEIKLSCLEYNYYIYSDEILKVYTTQSTTISSVYASPAHVERLNIAQDIEYNKVYIFFKRPDNSNWWAGAQIYVKFGESGEYERIGQFAVTASSIKLDDDIDDSQTSIPIDTSTLYGTFPDQGNFYIENEFISYGGITETEFVSCVRGSNATAHSSTEYCHSLNSTIPYFTFQDYAIGNTVYVLLLSVTVVGVPSVLATAPTDSLTLT